MNTPLLPARSQGDPSAWDQALYAFLVPPTQVAEWAGHSVMVLLRVYAKCIYGQEETARARIESALALPPTEVPDVAQTSPRIPREQP